MKKIIFVLIILISIIFLYSRYIEVNFFKINTIDISANVPDTFKDLKIVHFSDTLINEEYTISELEILVNNINELNPDIIFFTGDLIDNDYVVTEDEVNEIISILSNLDVTLYKFSIYGDNDLIIEDTYKNIMEFSEFTLLNNETFLLFYKDNTPITITGITNISNLESSYITDEKYLDSFNITLIHEPDKFDYVIDYTDLVFAGHYLGNYINIPIIGNIYSKNSANIYHEEYFTVDNTKLYLTNGLGTENLHVRLLNTPSINIYRFV